MAYEDITNQEIIEGVAKPFVFTSYKLRMAAGERIQQQEDRIKELENKLKELSE